VHGASHSIVYLGLLLIQTAAFGSFGRDGLDVPWERLDKVEALKSDVATLAIT